MFGGPIGLTTQIILNVTERIQQFRRWTEKEKPTPFPVMFFESCQFKLSTHAQAFVNMHVTCYWIAIKDYCEF